MNIDDDSLLDSIAAYLRREAAPEMPAELLAARGAGSRSWVWCGAAASVLAASIVAISLWGLQRTNDARPHEVAEQRRAKTESAAVMQAVDLAASLKRIESGFSALDVEIRELQRKALLLDARRKADELLAKF